MDEETVNLQNMYNSMDQCISDIFSAINNEIFQIDSCEQYIKDTLINKKVENEELLNELNAEYNNTKLTCESLQKTLNEKKNELKKYDDESEALENEISGLQKEYEKIEQDLIKIDKKTKLSVSDRKEFELSRKKLELYEQMTNIRWDYSVPTSSDVCRGYVVNVDTNYMKAFEFKKNADDQKFSKKLWKEIELGSGEDWSDIVAMTKVENSD